MEQAIAQVAVTSAPETTTFVILILGALFTLVLGGYVFTYKATRDIWKEIRNLKTNELKHIEERLIKLER